MAMDQGSAAVAKRLIDSLSADLHALCNEGKKKFPHIKEAAEIALAKVLNVNSGNPADAMNALIGISPELMMPFTMACDSKWPRLLQISLQSIQRMVTSGCVSDASIRAMVSCLWRLAIVELEELKVLQTVALLVSASDSVQGEDLAKCLVICFRLNFAKDPTVINTASATVRQLVSQVFERARRSGAAEVDVQDLKSNHGLALDRLPSAELADAAMLFQDLCRLVNTEEPVWLVGIVEMTRTLGLDLIELVLAQNEVLFTRRSEFVFLLKESMCLLMIKMFALNSNGAEPPRLSSGNALAEAGVDKPYFPITVRLMRLINVLSHAYSTVLITECEIFLSLLIKFLDSDKLDWQQVLSLEVIESIVGEPRLLRTYCAAYDMKGASAKVVEELVNAVNAFTLSLFDEIVESAGHRQEGSPVTKADDGSGQPVFLHRCVQIPMVTLPTHKIAKPRFLDLVDKVDPPTVPVGYFLTLAYGTTKAVATSLEAIASQGNAEVTGCLLNACWKSLLSTLNVLLEASNEKALTDSLLALMTSMLSTACKAASGDMLSACISYVCRSALPSDSVDGQISMKHLQVCRALLTAAFDFGSDLGDSWLIVFRTFQRLLAALHLKLVITDSDTVSVVSDTASSPLSPSVLADMPSLVRLLSEVAARTSSYSEPCLNDVVRALCTLCLETVQSAAPPGKESLHYALWQLVELTTLNLHRLQCIWAPVKATVFQLCNHGTAAVRLCGAFAFGRILRAAVSTDCIQNDAALRSAMIKMLTDLNGVPHEEVRLKQLDCVLYLLRSKEHAIHADLWPTMLAIVSDTAESEQSAAEGSLRLAFQTLKIVAADFLSQMGANCLRQFMLVNCRFGLRDKDLNTSLSAVGILWTAGDFLYREQAKRAGQERCLDDATVDSLFLDLYQCLSSLCLDPRPPVRKSASQTLFSTVTSHGALLKADSWRVVFWKILFQLVQDVKKRSFAASTFKADSAADDGGHILIHHSRDTESKQWAETSVITMNGVVKVFASRAMLLHSLGNADFLAALCALLRFLEVFAIGGNSEVSVGALKSFQDLMNSKEVSQCCLSVPARMSLLKSDQLTGFIEPFEKDMEACRFADCDNCYGIIWLTWLNIASLATTECQQALAGQGKAGSMQRQKELQHNTQFMNCLMALFVSLFPEVHCFVRAEQVSCFLDVLRTAVMIPIAADPLPLVSAVSSEMSASQKYVLQCMELFFWQSARKLEALRPTLPCLFDTLLTFFEYSCRPPEWCSRPMAESSSKTAKAGEKGSISMVFVPFAEKCLHMAVELYKETAGFAEVIAGHVAQKIFKKLSVPMRLKRRCPSSSTWNCCVSAFLSVLRSTLAVSRNRPHDTDLQTAWPEVMGCLNNFLFEKDASDELPCRLFNDGQRQEFMECKIVNAIRSEVLPIAKYLPREFVNSIMDLLYRGCIDDRQPTADGFGERKNLELSAACFDTLLMASISPPDLVKQCTTSVDSGPPVDGTVALNALLKRCRQVIAEYPTDERLAAGEPLPDYRSTELLQVFQTVVTMVETVGRKEQDSTYIRNIVKQLADVYPLLVDCVMCKREDVKKTLVQCLKAFRIFIGPSFETTDDSA